MYLIYKKYFELEPAKRLCFSKTHNRCELKDVIKILNIGYSGKYKDEYQGILNLFIYLKDITPLKEIINNSEIIYDGSSKSELMLNSVIDGIIYNQQLNKNLLLNSIKDFDNNNNNIIMCYLDSLIYLIDEDIDLNILKNIYLRYKNNKNKVIQDIIFYAIKDIDKLKKE